MAELNLLHHLISSESGAVAFLATALARYDRTEPPKGQLAFWADFAKLCGLQLSNLGPSKVKIEHDGVDLLALWDNWAIVTEAKTTSGSVRRGQLQAYYDRLRPQLGKEGVLAEASSMAIVFLTPAQVGKVEFDSLSVGTNDRKIHLEWQQLLSLLESSFSAPQPAQQEEEARLLSSLVLLGASQIRDLLTGSGPGPLAPVWTDERRRCRDFALQVQNRIHELWRGEELHFNPTWSDVHGDEVYANFSGDRAGNLYFHIFPSSIILDDNSLNSKLLGKLYFKLSLRVSWDRKAQFGSLESRRLAALFRVDKVNVDSRTFTVELPIDWSGHRSELCERVAGLFCLCLIVFRPLME